MNLSGLLDHLTTKVFCLMLFMQVFLLMHTGKVPMTPITEAGDSWRIFRSIYPVSGIHCVN